jgi:hypothetical protein
MKIYLIGNPLIGNDSLPLLLKDRLADAFPGTDIAEADPNENFIPEDDALIIDTVEGIPECRIFTSLNDFAGHKLVSPHDYDLYFHLQLLLKLRKIRRVRIVGIPAENGFENTVADVVRIIRSI